jgi:hypothetical protein
MEAGIAGCRCSARMIVVRSLAGNEFKPVEPLSWCGPHSEELLSGEVRKPK